MNDSQRHNPKSTNIQPDLDWSQVTETVNMLSLAVAQIGRAMKDGDESVGKLSDSFTSMAGDASIIADAGAQLPEGEAKDAILDKCGSISSQVHSAIVSFQFYDQLSQRVNHVSHSLTCLSQLLTDPGKLYSPYEWRGLQEKILSKYPTEAERVMFNAILDGSCIKEALDIYDATTTKEEDDDVELF